MARSGFDPSVYDSSVVGSFTPGAVYTYDGKEYLYARLNGATATSAANGHVVCWCDISATVPTVSLVVGDPDHRGMPAGVAVGTVTHGNYGFFQTRGIHAAVQTTGSITDGAPIIPDTSGSNDGDAMDLAANQEHFVFGTALSGGTGTVVAMIHLS